jgi:hypothetical protein
MTSHAVPYHADPLRSESTGRAVPDHVSPTCLACSAHPQPTTRLEPSRLRPCPTDNPYRFAPPPPAPTSRAAPSLPVSARIDEPTQARPLWTEATSPSVSTRSESSHIDVPTHLVPTRAGPTRRPWPPPYFPFPAAPHRPSKPSQSCPSHIDSPTHLMPLSPRADPTSPAEPSLHEPVRRADPSRVASHPSTTQPRTSRPVLTSPPEPGPVLSCRHVSPSRVEVLPYRTLPTCPPFSSRSEPRHTDRPTPAASYRIDRPNRPAPFRSEPYRQPTHSRG